ncbi:MAG TPA: hypothetical protein PKH39_14985 [Woeseiaceae bacterium]|nr:hypothetical protein [Woeseiaceae bacterium]
MKRIKQLAVVVLLSLTLLTTTPAAADEAKSILQVLDNDCPSIGLTANTDADRLRQQAILRREPSVVESDTSLADLVNISLPQIAKQKALLGLWLNREGSTEEFWQNLEEDKRFDRATIEELQMTLYLAQLTRNNLPLLLSLNDLRRSGVLNSWCDVAVIDEGIWRRLILMVGGDSGVTLPPDIPGSTPAEQLNNYVRSLRDGIDALLPSDSLRSTLQKAPDINSGIREFIKVGPKHPEVLPRQPEATNATERTVAPAIRAMNAQPGAIPLPPNACRMTVNYYAPEAPLVSAISPRLLVNDQFQIQCSFKKIAREVDWPECDDAARTSMQVLKLSEEAGGRYSGIVSIDDSTVGVSSSPESGGDFQSLKLWTFETPGTHKISCQIDNAFHFAAEGEEPYLNADVSVEVGTRSDGLMYRSFEKVNAATLRVRPMPSEAAPRLRGVTTESVQPATKQARRNDMVNPSLNPQPEVPSSKRVGGTDLVNPSLNPQPEVPSPKSNDTAITVTPETESMPELVVPKPVQDKVGS